MTKSMKLIVTPILITLALTLSMNSGAADNPDLDKAQIEAFADEIIEPALEASGVPGAILAVVNRDGLILVKGWGTANLETGSRVDASATLFNIASIGKSFTAILASQLIDEGQLDPDEDVNHYLKDFKVTGPRLTVRDLLGHQAGFDPNLTHLFVDLGEDASMSPQEMSRRFQLKHQPGVITAYDNAGYGLIGLILEAVSGSTYGQLLKWRIFHPLAMSASLYVEPDIETADLAQCTVPLGPDHIVECDYYPVYRASLRGAGGIATSAIDMARYMRMLLNEGELDGVRLMSREAFAALTDFDQYRTHPALPGFARSFTELNNSDRPEFVSGGSVPGFSSIMKIFPQAGVGIFFSFMGGQPPSFEAIPSRLIPHLLFNRQESALAAQGLQTLHGFPESFVEQFIPPGQDGPPESGREQTAVAAAGEDARAFTGHYFSPLGSDSLLRRLLRLSESIRLTAVDQDSFYLQGMGLEAAGRLSRIEPFLYQGEHNIRVAISNQHAQPVLTFRLSPANFVREPWPFPPSLTIPLFLLSISIVITGVVYLRPHHARVIRRYTAFTLTGLFLLLGSLYVELEYGAWFSVVRGQVTLPLLWRSTFHIGLLLMLGASILALLAMRKQAKRGGGKYGYFNHVHQFFLVLAVIVLIAVSGLWGLLGAF